MEKLYLKYTEDKKNMYIVDDYQRKIEGSNLDLYMELIGQEEIKKALLNDDTLYLYYSSNILLIENVSQFLKENRFPVFMDKIAIYTKKEQKETIKEAQKIVAKKGKEKTIKKSSSTRYLIATGVLGISILVASGIYIYNNTDFDKENKDEISYTTEYKNFDLNFKKLPNLISQYYMNDYSDIVKEFAGKYGLDERLVLAMIAQNGAVHNNTITDRRIGIMHVDIDRASKKVTYYNYETNEVETCTFTEEELLDLRTNIEAGMALFQEDLRTFDYNIPAALESYNSLHHDIHNELIEYAKEKYSSSGEMDNDEILSLEQSEEMDNRYYKVALQDLTDFNWLEKFTKEDGKIYTYEVLSFLPKDAQLEFKTTNSNEEIDKLIITINNELDKDIQIKNT